MDEVQRSKTCSYDTIIGSDIISDLDIALLFSELWISIGHPSKPEEYDYIPIKVLGVLQDKETYSMVYEIHIMHPILQQERERQSKILDTNYSKVNIDDMVEELDIKQDTKQKLSKTLKKFTKLFGGGLSKVDMKPINLEFKERNKLYATTYCNIPNMYKKPMRKEVDQMVDNNIIEQK